MWFMPNDATASIYTHVALARYIQGDLAGAEAELLRTERWCEQLPFPQGPFSLAYAHQMEVLIRIEAGQLERAGNVAINVGKLAEQHGFDAWVMVGATQQETVKALSALTESPADVTAIQSHIASITGFVNTWRALDMRALITIYDAVIARLLIATGQSEEARRRLQIALDLADETGMHFYDAELIRLRAHTFGDIDSRRADLRSAIELAHRQDARIFELRSAVDYFEASGKHAEQMLADAISCFPPNSTWPELARARSLVE
jgi:tetratricopeptide (TPR) repeat protein